MIQSWDSACFISRKISSAASVEKSATSKLALRVSGGEPLRFEFFEAACAPGFELTDDFFRVEIGRDDDVQVTRAAVDGMQNPAANGAVVGDGLLDESSLFLVEEAGIFVISAADSSSFIK